MNTDTCAEIAIQLIPAGKRLELAQRPTTTITSMFDLRVRATEHLTLQHDNGGACDGASFLADGVLLYAPTLHSKRENFTVLHELGHWLVEENDEIMIWLADQEEHEKILETVCDRIAQKLLVHPSEIQEIIGNGPLRAHHILELSEQSSASRPASAIALSGQLSNVGALVIIDPTKLTVTSSSVFPDPIKGWPKVIPWPGQSISSGHPLALLKPGESRTDRMTWETPWGQREFFYIDAYADDKRIYAVFSATDLWGAVAFHPNVSREFDDRLQLNGYCCGVNFNSKGYPCNTCKDPYCPECGRCKCDREIQRNQVCNSCYMSRPAQLFVDDVCQECQE